MPPTMWEATNVILRLVTVSLLAAFAAPSAQTQNDSPIAVELRNAPPEAANASLEGDLPALSRFYAQRQYQPAWTDGASLNAGGESVLRELMQARDEGLSDGDYLVTPISTLAAKKDPASSAHLEILVSLAAIRYAHDLGWGVTLPSEVDKDNSYDDRPFAADMVLDAVVQAPDAGAALRAYEPRTFVYRELKQALADLRAIQAGGRWKSASDGPVLKQGDTGPLVQELRARLVERGDLPAALATGDTFDADLTAALKRFQNRHGLKEDGVYGKNVISEVNVPIATRIQQVRLAMERIRWLPPTSSGRRIAVNIADFRTYVFDGDQITFETRAVVGKHFHETPMFNALMTYVVINPYWNVPPSITRSEILPKIKADPDYLAKNHMEMSGATVRQLPGPWNSLGRFKFMFPNPHNVYLHDTPAHTLVFGGRPGLFAWVRAARETRRSGSGTARRSRVDAGTHSGCGGHGTTDGGHPGHADSGHDQLRHGVSHAGWPAPLSPRCLRPRSQTARRPAAAQQRIVGAVSRTNSPTQPQNIRDKFESSAMHNRGFGTRTRRDR